MEEILQRAQKMAGERLSLRGEALFLKDCVEFKRAEHISYYFNIKDDREDFQVEIIADNDFEFHCSCEYNSVTSAVCEHCIAALHFMNEHKDVTKLIDKNVKYLLENYRNKLIVQAQSLLDDERLQLEPIFELKDNTMSLFYRVGTNKKYIIKDINTFMDILNAEGKYALNDSESIYLSLDRFSDSSKRLIDMLRSRHILKEVDYYNKTEGNRHFIIRGRNLDALFAYGYQYPVKMKKDDEKLLLDMNFVPIPPKIELSIIKQDTTYYLKHNIDFDIIERGNYGLYLLKNTTFYKGNAQYASLMEPLLQSLNNSNNLELSEEVLYAFYSQVLKQVQPYVEFTGEILNQLHSTIPTLKMKLDIDEQGRPYFEIFKEANGNVYHLLKEDSIVSNEIVHITKILKPYIDHQKDDIHYLADSHEQFYNFINDVIPEISPYVEVYISDKVKAIRLRKIKSIGVGVSFDTGLLQMNFDFDDMSTEEMNKIMTAYREKRKFYRLKDGSFIDLEDETLHQFSNLLDDLGLDATKLTDTVEVDRSRGLFLDYQMRENPLIMFSKDKGFSELIDDIQDIQAMKFDVPKPLQPILRDYQKVGYRWLKMMQKYNFGGILADDMGIGKTIQVLALLSDSKGTPSIVICPSSIVFNWKNEIEKFTPYLNCLVIAGNANQRQEKIKMINDYDVVITSYDYLKRDVEFYEDITFNYEILDEAQYIKNFNTKNALATKRLRSQYRLALTGTPIENSLAELWSIMDFLMPNYLFSYADFKENYEIPIVKEQSEEKKRRLASMIAPFVLRRVKKDVLTELPDKIETDSFVEFSEEERKLYAMNVLKMKDMILEKGRDNKIFVLSMLMKLRQLCNEPRLVYDNIAKPSSKMQACLELIERSIANNKKILVFSQFTSLLDLIQNELQNRHITNYYLNGSTPKLQRTQMASDFNEDDTPVFLISLKAGGTGLNLTGAEVVIHFDPWWNISAQNQASDRAYRIGQKNVVQVFNLIMKDSIEEKILNIQSMKKQLSDAIIEDNGTSILNMSTEEILDLF